MFNKMRKLNQLYMYLMERESSGEINIVLDSCNALEMTSQHVQIDGSAHHTIYSG